MAVTPQTANFPVPVPAAGLPPVDPNTGQWTPGGLDLVSRIWAGLQGTNGMTDQVATAQSQITGLTTQMGNFYASGLFRVSVHTSLNGADATIAISAAASAGGAPVTAAIFLSAFTSTGKGQIILQGDQVYATADGITFVQLFGTATTDLNFSGVVANGAVLTQHLEDNCVTGNDYTISTGTVTQTVLATWYNTITGGSSGNNFVTHTFTAADVAAGAYAIVQGQFECQGVLGTGTDGPIYWRIRRGDGTVLSPAGAASLRPKTQVESYTVTGLVIDRSPLAGANDYYLEFNAPAGSDLCIADSGRLILQACKR